jgi:hypothetical protein
MSGGSGAKDAPHTHTEDERAREQALFGLGEEERRELQAWVGQNLPYVRRTAAGQRPLYWIYGLGLAVGLAAYVGGFLLKSSATTEPLGLIADLLYTLGEALWAGVVVVLFLQVIPELKRRQFKRALDAYEAAQREEAGVGSEEASAD